MNAAAFLLERCRQLGVTVALWPDGSLKVKPPGLLPADLREQLRRHKAELLSLLKQQQSSLIPDLPPGAAEAFPDWQGILVKSAVLGFSVWVVRDRGEGEDLARETGHPAVLLDDVLCCVGKSADEVVSTLFPVLILPQQ